MIAEFFALNMAYAQSNISEEVIDSLEEIEAPRGSNEKIEKRAADPKKSTHKSILASRPQASGNLDSSLIRKSEVDDFRSPGQISKNVDSLKEANLLPGTRLQVLINSDIVAYVDSESPLEATVLAGALKGSTLIGNATMDSQTKRVAIRFNRLRKSSGSGVFEISGIVRDRTGEVGLDGKHETFYWNYFFSEALLNAASGMADATTQRTQQTNGGFVVVPSVDSAVKQGVAAGFSKSAERLGERLRSLPEYVTAKGPFVVQVLITN